MFVLVGAIIIGLTVGLMGSGGSVLTVPLLVYVVHHEAQFAIAESMAIVGIIAVVSIIPYIRQNHVSWRQAVLLGIPGLFGAMIGSWISLQFLSAPTKMIFLSVIMLVTSWRMLRKPKIPKAKEIHVDSRHTTTHPTIMGYRIFGRWLIVLEIAQGLSIGLIAGTVGVGGGFLIVPTLVLVGGLGMRTSIGTSLAVIAMQSFVGFASYQWQLMHRQASVDWSIIALFAIVGSAAGLLGQKLGQSIRQESLRRGFAFLLLAMGTLIVGKEILGLSQ